MAEEPVTAPRARRDLLRDIVALNAIPATWVGASRAQIAESLAEALHRITSVDLVYVRLDPAGAGVPGGCAAFPPAALDGAPSAEAAEAALRHLDPLSSTVLRPAAPDMPHEPGAWLLHPIGAGAFEGGIALASDAPGFPTPEVRLVASMAASSAANHLRNTSLHRELLAARREIAVMEKMSALGQLVAGVAHEVRTPLTYATNHVHIAKALLAAPAPTPPEALARDVDASLDAIADALDRINALVGNLRRFTKMQPGDRPLTSLSSVVHQGVEIFRATHSGRVAVETRLESVREVRIDRVQIQEIVLNLLENAVDAMPRGGTITVTTRDTPEDVELAVTDEGVGIPPDLIPRIFEPFFTTKVEGTGLGLAIIARIVEAHHGTITVSNGPKGGACFIVRFPGRAVNGEPPA